MIVIVDQKFGNRWHRKETLLHLGHLYRHEFVVTSGPWHQKKLRLHNAPVPK